MAKDEEEEREFLAELKARSGRNLDEWMAAITAQGFAAPHPAASEAADPRPPSQREVAQLEALLAAAKGYRPLYWLLEAAIRKALPGVVVTPKATHIAIGAPHAFAALTLHASELRLGLALGDRPYDGRLQKARLKGVAAAISHMLVLTDARQVNEELLGLIKEASTLAKAVKGGAKA